jgi:tRNA-2-methylthio-N6-dimethylallyladenosine synthase
MNLADSELLGGHLGRHGFAAVDRPEDADVILLNTCAIREHAEERVIGRVTQLQSLKLRSPDVRIGLVGCMAQHHRAKLLERLPFLDLILGPDEYRKLPTLLGLDDPSVEVRLGREETYADVAPARRDGVRAWVTVMRGCDQFCTFCVVPYVRGRERSLPLAAILAQVRDAAAAGFREVVFLGQTVNAYRDGELDFADLLRGAAATPGIERIRFTSPHPIHMTERVIDVMAMEPKLCPQVHLPLQSASNAVLERMERGYSIEEYDALAARLRERIPGIELSTDVIVGFPGESEEDFLATCAYLERIGYDHAFLFAYSPREGTKAYRFAETIPAEEKQRRLASVIALQERISAERSRSWIGRTVEVLVEGPAKRQKDWLAGKSREFKTVVFPAAGRGPGDLVRATVVDATPHTLIAEPVAAAEEVPCIHF